MSAPKDTIVVGAGPVGCVLALVLQRRGMGVSVYEKRGDMRAAGAAAGRSINLVLTARGLRALAILGLEQEVLALTTPVFGRMMHSVSGELTYTAYGKDDGERNYSVSRGELNIALLNAVEAAKIPIHFEHALERADLSATDSVALHFERPGGPLEVHTSRAFGADGAASALRTSLLEHVEGECLTEMLPDGYKELLFPAVSDGTYAMSERALHIWPRGREMLMGLPNRDGSFTGTLYMPIEGEVSFAAISDVASAQALFEASYPDAIPLLGPEFAKELVEAPLGRLGTVRCFPWVLEDRVLLAGDAAHPIVPFFGQGLNCGFEDVAILAGLLEEGGELGAVFAAYQAARKPAGDAIREMALENFVEMSDRVGDPAFILKKRVEARIEQALAPLYRTRYTMVVYSSIPYHKAQEAGRIQERILSELCEGISAPEEVDLTRAAALVAQHLTPFVEAEGLDLTF
ncbi:MAG: FAD-dependent monooxygenase [Planctomycetes bacterium]|nr:FAD-dependent monooxygenase [Planctomycetota bacterium]